MSMVSSSQGMENSTMEIELGNLKLQFDLDGNKLSHYFNQRSLVWFLNHPHLETFSSICLFLDVPLSFCNFILFIILSYIRKTDQKNYG